MVQSGRSIVLIMSMLEAEFLQQSQRCRVGGIVPREEFRRAQIMKGMKGIVDDRACAFLSIAATPNGTAQVKTDLINRHAFSVRTQFSATDVFIGRQQENRPILNAVCSLSCKLIRKPFLYLIR